MTIRQLYDQLDTMDEGARAEQLSKLAPNLSGVTHATIRDYQNQHIANAEMSQKENWDAFRVGQNKIIKECIDLELSDGIGAAVRAALGLPPLTWESEV